MKGVLHKQKLRIVKPTLKLRGTEPKKYFHLQNRKKKELIEEGIFCYK